MILKGKTEVSGGPSTIMVGYMLGIASELESRGVNAVDLLERAGVSNPLSNDPFNRCPSSLLCDVLRLSVEATQDRHFGLHAARSMKAPDLHVLGLGLMASGSMLAFCQRLARFLPLIHRTGSVQVLEEPVGYRIVTVSEMAALCRRWVLSSLHSTGMKRSASRSCRRLATAQLLQCTCRPSPCPR